MLNENLLITWITFLMKNGEYHYWLRRLSDHLFKVPSFGYVTSPEKIIDERIYLQFVRVSYHAIFDLSVYRSVPPFFWTQAWFSVFQIFELNLVDVCIFVMYWSFIGISQINISYRSHRTDSFRAEVLSKKIRSNASKIVKFNISYDWIKSNIAINLISSEGIRTTAWPKTVLFSFFTFNRHVKPSSSTADTANKIKIFFLLATSSGN